MERADRHRGRLFHVQLYDDSQEVADPEEVASVHSPTSCSHHWSESRRSSRRVRGLMPASSSSSSSSSSNSDEFDKDCKEPVGRKLGGGPNEEDSEEEDSNDDDEPSGAPEGAYNPADYANLPVSTDIKELFRYITCYTPQSIELEHSLKPFIPDFIPAVGDIDAFLKVPRPDSKPDNLGLLVLDEPSVKQSDPTVLSLWLSEETKQHVTTKVTSIASPQSNPCAVDSWVESISALHRSNPPASVQYGRPMPDIDSLMQEWPAELEELLGRLQLPPARLSCDLPSYVGIICSLLDIPVYGSRVQSLHLLFSLYLEFRDSQHFTHRASTEQLSAGGALVSVME